MEESLITDFKSLGVDEKSAVLAMQVFLDLCEVKKYWDVMYEHNDDAKKIVIKAKKNASETHSLFIPISAYEELSFTKMNKYLDLCKTDNAFLAIVHPDSTCVYYEIAQGLQEPSHETTGKHLRVNKEKLDLELKKHQKIIEQAALYGIPININKEDNAK